MITKHNILYILLFISVLSFSHPTHAQRMPNQFDTTITMGLPQTAGFSLRYNFTKSITAGAGFGKLWGVEDTLLKKRVTLKSVSLGDSFELVPDADYDFTSLYAFIRLHPGGGNFFFQADYIYLLLSANITGTIRSTTGTQTRSFSSSALNATLNYKQHLAGASVGYQLPLGNTVFLEGAVGAVYVFQPQTSFSLSAQLEAIAAIAGVSETQITDAGKSVGDAITDEVDKFRKKIPVIPQIYIALGIHI